MDKDLIDLKDAWSDAQSSSATPPCDTDKYREHLEEYELSKEEEDELLKVIWSIMAGFVEIGFGVDSIQFLPQDAKEPTLIRVGKELAVVKEIEYDE